MVLDYNYDYDVRACSNNTVLFKYKKKAFERHQSVVAPTFEDLISFETPQLNL